MSGYWITVVTFCVTSLALGETVGTFTTAYWAGMGCVLVAYIGGYLRGAWEYDRPTQKENE